MLDIGGESGNELEVAKSPPWGIGVRRGDGVCEGCMVSINGELSSLQKIPVFNA